MAFARGAIDPVHAVACRLAEVKVATGSRHDLKVVLLEAQGCLLDAREVSCCAPEMAYLRTLSVSSLSAAVKQALDSRDYRSATALALINRPVWGGKRPEDADKGSNTFERICAHITENQWMEVIKLWPSADWFHLLLLLIDRVSASQMNIACSFLSQLIPTHYSVIPAVISGDIELLESMGEVASAEYFKYHWNDDTESEHSEMTEEADDCDDQLSFESRLSKQDHHCVNMWLSFVNAMTTGLSESVETQWRHYGIVTTIVDVLVPILERHLLSDSTLSALYELTAEVQKGHFQTIREMFARLASSSDFALVTTFLPALRRAVAFAAETLPSSRNNS
uniref:Nuclear pore complex protein Nup85 n=1 Tax=Steinernema glaseri TaxID=37863 RepID=A0A1I8A973_9BILA